MSPTFEIRCRGIISDNNEVLLVAHAGKSKWLVLPGGHLDWGEDIIAGLTRELVEELGVKPDIGELLYVHSFIHDTTHVVEFFFAVNNGADFRNYHKKTRTHAFELENVVWVALGSNVRVRPQIIAEHIELGTLLLARASVVHDGL